MLVVTAVVKPEMIDFRRASVAVEELSKLTFAAEGMDTCLLKAKNHKKTLFFNQNKLILNGQNHQKFWETFGNFPGLESKSLRFFRL